MIYVLGSQLAGPDALSCCPDPLPSTTPKNKGVTLLPLSFLFFPDGLFPGGGQVVKTDAEQCWKRIWQSETCDPVNKLICAVPFSDYICSWLLCRFSRQWCSLRLLKVHRWRDQRCSLNGSRPITLYTTFCLDGCRSTTPCCSQYTSLRGWNNSLLWGGSSSSGSPASYDCRPVSQGLKFCGALMEEVKSRHSFELWWLHPTSLNIF